VFGLLGFTGLASGVYAQSATAPSEGAATSGPTQPGLDEIIVTAQRKKEREQDVPITITELSATDLANAGVNSARELGNLVPGFVFSQFGTNPQPALRGVSTTLSDVGAENPIALYIDGVYHGPAALLLNEFNDVERIEVLKGPQGTLFGRNATGGAVQIFTRDPSFETHLDVSADEGYYTGNGGSHSAYHQDEQIFFTTPLIDNLAAISISGGYSWTPGYFTNAISGDNEGEISKLGFRSKLLLTPMDGLKITLAGYYIKNNEAGLISYSALNGMSAAAQYPQPQNVVAGKPWQTLPGDDITSAFVTMNGESVKFEYEVPAGVLSSLTAYNYFRSPGAQQSLSASGGTDACFLTLACLYYNTITVTKEVSQEFSYASRQFGILSFTSGLYYYKGWGLVTGYIQQPIFAGGILAQNDSADNQSYAAYTEATLKPTDDLSVILGLRYTREPTEGQLLLPGNYHEGKKTFNSTTPRVSVVYKLTPSLNAYATYSQGFKSGNAGANNAAAPIPFTPVQPEKLSAYETGLKFATSDLTANIAAYYYNYTNKQEQVFYGASYFFSNTGPVVIYGLDADTSFRFDNHFSMRGALSWIPTAKYKDFPASGGQSTTTVPFLPDGTCAPFGGCGEYESLGAFDATGKRLIRTPKWSASSTAAYETDFAGGHFDTSATFTYTTAAGLEITDTVEQGSYATLAAQAGYRFRDSNFRLGVYGRNLTNKAYLAGQLVNASGFLGNYGPPREVGVSLRYAF
jgi:iron complex outermembrane receptor protein